MQTNEKYLPYILDATMTSPSDRSVSPLIHATPSQLSQSIPNTESEGKQVDSAPNSDIYTTRFRRTKLLSPCKSWLWNVGSLLSGSYTHLVYFLYFLVRAVYMSFKKREIMILTILIPNPRQQYTMYGQSNQVRVCVGSGWGGGQWQPILYSQLSFILILKESASM